MNTNVPLEPAGKTTRRRKFKIRWVFYFILLLIGGLAVYAWATGARQTPIETGEPHMRAIIYTDYGPPDVLSVREIKKPVPNDDQVLVKVRAASINPLEWHTIRGTPYIIRAMGMGLRKPKSPRVGVDLAGQVEAVGKNVTQLKPGDEVFGTGGGSLSEYARAREARLALKPANITFEQAAGVPVAAITALQGLRDNGNIHAGQKVLINGASGGVGTFAVQIAKSFGAEVTGVCSTKNLDLVRSLGADHVIDYTKEDFTKGAERYDLILDNVGNQPLSGFIRALKPKGTCVLVGGGGPNDGRWIGAVWRPVMAFLYRPFVEQKLVFFVAEIRKDDLTILADLMQSGKVKPVVDKTYPLDQVPEAMQYLEQGHARGKVIITIANENHA
jgi:NADPH:quinone reductase-like Zn-dependent oxidoreductase